MDTRDEREGSFVRALMVLGPKPIRQHVKRIDDNMTATDIKRSVDSFIASGEYLAAVDKYWLREIANKEARNRWVEDFYYWQKENGDEFNKQS